MMFAAGKIEGSRKHEKGSVEDDMTHKLWFNRVQGFAYMQLVGELYRDDLIELFDELGREFSGQRNHNLLIDLRLSPGLVPRKRLRDLFREKAVRIGLDRVAILGADPASRMTFKILMSILHRTGDTRFCETENQALAWLRKGES